MRMSAPAPLQDFHMVSKTRYSHDTVEDAFKELKQRAKEEHPGAYVVDYQFVTSQQSGKVVEIVLILVNEPSE